jgi:GT2 family glycosyltransferase
MGEGGRGPIAVLVVTWSSQGRITQCLRALLLAGAERIVVVDNGSTDGTREILARRTDLEVVRSERNLGFAGGVALGMRYLEDAEYVFIVNDDAEVRPDALERLLAATKAPGSEHVGAWTARLLLPAEPDGTQQVNSTGNVVLTDGRGADRGWLEPADGPEPKPDVFGFCGAAALLRVAAVKEVGGFDESLFLYYEDTDLSWRLRLGGWGVRYVHDAVVVHAHAQSSGVGSEVFLFYNWRNRLVCLLKNAPLPLALRELARLVLQCLAAPFAGAESRRTARTRWRALLSFLAMLPATIRQRREVTRRAVAPRQEVARLLIRS